MNCQEFENIIIDLARGQMMDAALRESGLAHRETCARCAARLADEQALTAGLRALSASTESEAAPPRIEAALRAAFRTPHPQVAADDRAVALAAVAFIQPPSPASQWRRWAVAAAAVILVALAAQSWWRGSSSQQIPDITVVLPTPPMPAPKLQAPPIVVQQERQPEIVRGSTLSPGVQQVRYIKHGNGTRHGRPDAASDIEIATEFFPLTYDSDLTQLEGGHVVRVLMPHSALATFGLPMNVERDSEPVKADVVVGNDGLARAIRFVH